MGAPTPHDPQPSRRAARIAILGAGAFGTALCIHLAQLGHEVRLWAYEPHVADELARRRSNSTYLPGFTIPPSVQVSSTMGPVLHDASIVLLVTPSHALRVVAQHAAPDLPRTAAVVCATKGFEGPSGLLATQVLLQALGPTFAERLAAMSGPSFALEVAEGRPTALVVAAADPELAADLQVTLSSERFRAYPSTDPIGVQVGGAVKNVIAIAVGISDGLGFGDNARATLVTRGLAELTRFAVHLGGRADTMVGLAGLGDLVLTCMGNASRNRSLGVALGRGMALADALGDASRVVEGVQNAENVEHLAARQGLDLPICHEVYRILHEGLQPAEGLPALLRRALREEA